MTPDGRVPHFLRQLAKAGMPRRHVFIDCESVATERAGQHEQRWQLAVSAVLDAEKRKTSWACGLQRHPTPADLWDTVTGHCRQGRRTILWAHNLGYDLRISRALLELPARGFELDGIVLERTSSWATFRRGDATLACCDLFSFAPTSLANVAADLDLIKPALPSADQVEARWRRCEADVRILRHAVMHLLTWLEAEDLGPFRPTGSGQAWAAYRRKFLGGHRVLVHDNRRALEAERRAMWTGRAEAWRHGHCTDGPYTEYDLQAAYAHVAAECDLPSMLAGRTTRTSTRQLPALIERHAVLAHCHVQTDLPLVPAAEDEYIVWPVGSFDTWLWDPELTMLLDHGVDVTVSEAFLYRRAPILHEFATWALTVITGAATDVPPLARRVVKHWSRALVGRMGLRYRRWETWGRSDVPGLRLGTMLDLETGVATDMLHAGHELRVLGAMDESPVSVPQVTGWVMSECRRRLWRLVSIAGEGNVIYMDTDAVIVNPEGAARIEQSESAAREFSLRPKGHYQTVTIRGPRHLEVESTSRIAGVPRSAVRTGPLTYEGEIWRSLKESMARGELDHVATTPRTFRPHGRDHRRLHIDGGLTRPRRLGPPEPA